MQCQGTNKDGSPCKRFATEGSEFCSTHQPETVQEPVQIDDNITCGHENMHFIQTTPDQEYACCELELGHEGNHGALIHVIRHDKEGNPMIDDWIWSEWDDMAGIPVSQIKPEAKDMGRFGIYDKAWEPVNQ